MLKSEAVLIGLFLLIFGLLMFTGSLVNPLVVGLIMSTVGGSLMTMGIFRNKQTG